MNKEETLKLITMQLVTLDNLSMQLVSSKERGKLKREINILRGQTKKLIGMIFKDADKGQIENYDEWSGVNLDLVEVMFKVGFERSLAILEAFNKGEIKEEK